MQAFRARAVFLGILVVFVGVGRADAAVLSWSISGTIAESNFTSQASMEGLEFKPNINIQVTSLGWYDDTFSTTNGLATSHQVGIWNATTAALLGSVTVPAGTGATKINQFRFADLGSPLNLTSGTQYIIAGLGGTSVDPNHLVTPMSTMLIDSAIAIGARRLGGLTFSFPGTPITASPREMGPTFQFVPEPTTLSLLAFGVCMLRRGRTGFRIAA